MSRREPPKYVYDIPYVERKEICRILDENNQWEGLGGGLMSYSPMELSEFGRCVYRGGSPTDALLSAWGNQNHTINELFTLLARFGHYRAMKAIVNLVDDKLHVLLKDPSTEAQLIDLDTFHKSKRLPESPSAEKKDEVKLEVNGNLAADSSVGSLPQIPYAELQHATENWERRYIIGKGGFGTVYRGIWKNTAVAIKRMEQRSNPAFLQSQLRQSMGELKFLNSCRHDNILPLYGFCLEGEHPCLVYQFMPNGSLEDRLLCRNRTYPLNWTLRYNIARAVACGVQFLHSIGTKPLIHGDIKSANILLDKNFEAKVGDFGLAREMTGEGGGASYVTVSRVHGTRPYLPDEYLRSKKLSTKVDTYSFGIMLYEILAGQRAYEESRHRKFLKDAFEDADNNVESLKDAKGGSESPDIFWILLRIAKGCTVRLAKDRPEMVQVLKSIDELFSQASIRTVSSHVTGLPFLFEQTQSLRPASFAPSGNSTNPRLSPVDMRTQSPQWIPNSSLQPPNGRKDSGGSSLSHRASPFLQLSATPPIQTDMPRPIAIQDPSKGERAKSEEGEEATGEPRPPPDQDDYLPLCIEQRDSEELDQSTTVFPLITQLGIKH